MRQRRVGHEIARALGASACINLSQATHIDGVAVVADVQLAQQRVLVEVDQRREVVNLALEGKGAGEAATGPPAANGRKQG